MQKGKIIESILERFSNKEKDGAEDSFQRKLKEILVAYDDDHINIDMSAFPQEFFNEIKSIFIHKTIQENRQRVVDSVRGKTDYYSITRHYVFTGNPGTGKSTAARVLGFFLKELGILDKGGFIEKSRADLVGAVVGETEEKTKKIINEAIGNVLFINEAYELTSEDSSKDYGRIAVQEIMKAMEDNREQLVVIVDGYHEQMRNFFKMNPGVRDRFSRHIFFENLDNEKLLKIAEVILDEFQYKLEPSQDALNNCHTVLTEILEFIRNNYKQKDYVFANARTLRNLLDMIIEEHENRIYYKKLETRDDFTIIKLEDIKSVFTLLKERENKKKELLGDSYKG